MAAWRELRYAANHSREIGCHVSDVAGAKGVLEFI